MQRWKGKGNWQRMMKHLRGLKWQEKEQCSWSLVRPVAMRQPWPKVKQCSHCQNHGEVGGGAGITNDLTSGLLWGFPLVKPNCEMEDEWIQVILSVEVSLLGHRAECRRVEDGRCAWRNRKIITTVTFRISSWHRQLCCVWNSVCCFSASLAEVENVPFLYGRASGSKLEVLCL